jgi:hypothetical protein
MTDVELVLWMRDRNIHRMQFDFSGGGDSGEFTNTTAYDQNDKPIEDPISVNPNTNEGKVRYIIDALQDINEESFYDAVDDLSEVGGDWWNNSGGYGNVTMYATGKWEVYIVHNEYVGVGEPNEDGDYDDYEQQDGECSITEGEVDMTEVPDGSSPVSC